MSGALKIVAWVGMLSYIAVMWFSIITGRLALVGILGGIVWIGATMVERRLCSPNRERITDD